MPVHLDSGTDNAPHDQVKVIFFFHLCALGVLGGKKSWIEPMQHPREGDCFPNVL